MGASIASVYTDILSSKSELEKGRFSLMGVYFIKGAVDGLVAVRYLGTLLSTINKERAKQMAGKITIFLEQKILGIRLLAALMLWEAQVAIILLQVVVAWLSDNDLQIWCKKCVFGIEPVKEPWDKQSKVLEDAIKEAL